MNSNFFSELFDTRGMRYALIAVFALLAFYLFAQTITTVQDFGRSGVPATDTITVQGDGQATLPPDVARVSFTVQNTAAAVADAQVATTKQTNTAIDAVKALGIADKDIKTQSYTITPQYSYPRCPTPIMPMSSGPMVSDQTAVYCNSTPKITGYQVAQSIRVTMRDLTKVGTLLEKLGTLEVQNVYGPDFALDDATAGYDAARADAIDKAKTQAMLLAKQLGVHLGKIVNFTESNGGYPYPMPYTAMSAGLGGAKAAAPTIPTGENTYNASVSITYEIR
ncbi:SIMPL domain-containing protein [Patescibacteria group bacterium]|nr:SIMPL domain-containing protein [Patescibacteria group bacterium]